MEPTKPKRKLIPVKYYLTEEEFAEFQKIVFTVYEYKGIPRPTIGAFAKAAGYKWYNEINQIAMVKGKLFNDIVGEIRDTTN